MFCIYKVVGNISTENLDIDQQPLQTMKASEIRKQIEERNKTINQILAKKELLQQPWYKNSQLNASLIKKLENIISIDPIKRFTDIFPCKTELNKLDIEAAMLSTSLEIMSKEENFLSNIRYECKTALKSFISEDKLKDQGVIISHSEESFLVVLPNYSIETVEEFAFYLKYAHKITSDTSINSIPYDFIYSIELKDREHLIGYCHSTNQKLKKTADLFLTYLNWLESSTKRSKAGWNNGQVASSFLREETISHKQVRDLIPATIQICALIFKMTIQSMEETENKKQTTGFKKDCYNLSLKLNDIAYATTDEGSYLLKQKQLYALIYDRLQTLVSSDNKYKIARYKKYLHHIIKPTVPVPKKVEKASNISKSLSEDFFMPSKKAPKQTLKTKQKSSISAISNQSTKLDVSEPPLINSSSLQKEIDEDQEVPLISFQAIKRNKRSARNIQYHSRVKRWFKLKLHEKIPFQEYKNIDDALEIKKIIIRHRAGWGIIEPYIFDTTYAYEDGNSRHLLIAYEYEDGKLDLGITTCCFEDKNLDLCWHRFHSVRAPNELMGNELKNLFEQLVPKMNLTEDVEENSFVENEESNTSALDKLNEFEEEFNSLSNYAKIYDRQNNINIYIFRKQI